MTTPKRVVSLVPSLTELVFWFGAGDRLVGRTRFCVEPTGEVENVAVVGGTKNPRIERVVGLRPDLVIVNREENRREDVEALQAAGLRVMLTNPTTVAGALDVVVELGRVLGAEAAAGRLVEETREALGEAATAASAAVGRMRVFVAVWKDPLMGLGSESYGHDLLERTGAINVLRDRPRYPEVSWAEIAGLAPGLVLLPDEPYPFKERDRQLYENLGRTQLIDGKLLWWYGPRMPAAVRMLTALFGGGMDEGFGKQLVP